MSDIPGSAGAPDNAFVFDFPTMAVAALEHRRIEAAGRSAQQVYDAARAFAETELLTALAQGAALPAERRANLAQRMENEVVGEYLLSFGVQASEPYVALNLNMNLNLDWAFGSRAIQDTVRLNPTPRIGALMARRESLRLLLFGGHYDLTRTVAAAQSAITHAGVPMERVEMIALPGPHALHADDALRASMAQRIRQFLVAGIATR